MQERDAAKAAMGNAGMNRTVLALTETPADFAARLGCPWLEFACESTVGGFLERLGQQPVSGFVLEVGTVLRAAGPERGLLFELAGAFPLLRVRSAGQGGLSFLDDAERFLRQVRGQVPRPARHVPRVPVLLRAELRRPQRVLAGAHAVTSAATVASARSSSRVPPRAGARREPPFLPPAQPALFLDLSACGGALGCDAELCPGEELDLRILELADTSPIAAQVCWSGRRGSRSGRRCSGVRFLNMRPGQARELDERRLRAAGSSAVG